MLNWSLCKVCVFIVSIHLFTGGDSDSPMVHLRASPLRAMEHTPPPAEELVPLLGRRNYGGILHIINIRIASFYQLNFVQMWCFTVSVHLEGGGGITFLGDIVGRYPIYWETRLTDTHPPTHHSIPAQGQVEGYPPSAWS